MARHSQISFIIPVKDEEENIPKLTTEIISICNKIKKSYEIIFVDDGSIDNSFKEVKKLSKKNKNIKVIKLRGNFGKSVALSVGFSRASASIVFTMDGDLQDNPKEIPRFLKEISSGFDMVSGWKKTRYDPISKTLPSRIGNLLARSLTGVNIHDFNSGYKAYRKEVIQNLNLYGELYKFIPILASKQNFKVTEIVVEHRRRIYGKSKFGWERNLKGLLDLITITFLTGYLRKPGHFFGSVGAIFFFGGFLIGLYITYLRLTTGTIDYRFPLLFLGVLLMVVGIQFVSTGLLAEMIISTKEKPDYEKYIVKN